MLGGVLILNESCLFTGLFAVAKQYRYRKRIGSRTVVPHAVRIRVFAATILYVKFGSNVFHTWKTRHIILLCGIQVVVFTSHTIARTLYSQGTSKCACKPVYGCMGVGSVHHAVVMGPVLCPRNRQHALAILPEQYKQRYWPR
jgi:hypothetical protein